MYIKKKIATSIESVKQISFRHLFHCLIIVLNIVKIFKLVICHDIEISLKKKIIFRNHKITNQIKQQNNKRYVYQSSGIPSGSEWNCFLEVLFALK